MRLIDVLKTAGRDRVRIHEKPGCRTPFGFEPFLKQTVFVIQHGVETMTADITVSRAIDCVAHRHVISGYGLGDRTRSAADPEAPAPYLLAGADSRGGAV